MIKYVVYSRYSSDLQSATSIDDQIRKCREYADKAGWTEVRTYEDAAVSGAGMDRLGFQRLMTDAASTSRDFDVILVDDTSRLSRSFADSVNIHQRLAHYGVRVVAVSQGIDTLHEQSDLMIAVHGITDSLYVKELAKKTHRGLEGKVLKGLSAGGRCFGYDNVRDEAIGTKLVINDAEAKIVVQIFEWSAAGHSLKTIAGLLNDAKVPPPQKRSDRSHATWCPTAIRAMLRRELYIGRRVWNQTKFVKTPGTNKRIARPRPRSEWQVHDMPELRIISDELWLRVQKRQERLKEVYQSSGRGVSRAASSPYLLSGFLVCGTCGAKLIIVHGAREGAKYGCPQHWNRRACSNSVTIRSRDLEHSFFQQLQEAVLTPAAVEYLVQRLCQVQHKKKASNEHEKRRKELKTEIDRLVAAIAAVGHSDALLNTLKAKENELRELSAAREESKERTPDEIRSQVLSAIQDIPKLMSQTPQAAKTKLAQHVSSIRLLPQSDGTYYSEGEWDLLGERGPVMVAGVGFEPTTFGL